MLSYTDRYADHPYTREIFDQLDRGYTEVHTSSRGRARLFERKTTQ